MIYFNFTMPLLYRNRALEQKKYTLDLDQETLDVRDFNLSPRALAAMHHFQAVELPPAFVHSVHMAPRRRGVKYMKCEAFRLDNEFPNNICLLTGNRVMYCIDFQSSSDDAGAVGNKFSIEGFIFGKIKPAFLSPESSARIGFFWVSHLDFSKIQSVSAVDLVSKCFIFPRGADLISRPEPDIDPLPIRIHAKIKSYVLSDGVTKEMFRASICEESRCSQQSPDYWWVHSLIIPGRFPNFAQ